MLQDFPQVTIQQMVNFITVVDNGGFAHAADELHMTQSAISKSIAKLESELGIRLFNRSTRFLELTEAGRILYESWKLNLAVFQNSYRDALRFSESNKNSIRIGLCNTARPDRYFSAISQKFSGLHPEVSMDVESQYMTDLVEGLQKRYFDMIVLPDFMHHYIENLGMSWIYIAKDKARLLMSSTHSLAKRKSLNTKDILDLNYAAVSIFNEGEEYIMDLTERFAPFGKEPTISYLYKTAYDIRYLFKADETVLLVDAYFDYPNDTSDFVIVPVADQLNGLICVWDPAKQSAETDLFLDVVKNNL